MNEERDEPNLMGQIAGIIAAMSALIHALPPTVRQRVERQLHARFASLLDAMHSPQAGAGNAEREGAEWVRDLFLKEIEKAGKKRTGRKEPKASPARTESRGFDIEL